MSTTERVAALGSRSTISGWAATAPPLKTAHYRVRRRLDYPASLGLDLNVEPTPTWLVTQIFPPCSSTNFRQRVSPSPVPSAFFSAVPTWRNSSNRLLILRRDTNPGVAH